MLRRHILGPFGRLTDVPDPGLLFDSAVLGGMVSGYVFVSYAHEDLEYVARLVHFLRGEGVEVWYDAHLVPGKRWDDALVEKIGSVPLSFR